MDYTELFKPYTADGHTIEGAIRYWRKVAVTENISSEIMELAINEIFNELANGKEYPKDHCPCGCGIDKAATALIHAVRDKMLAIDSEVQIQVKDLLQQRNDIIIKDQIQRITGSYKQYKKLRPPLKERSPVLRYIRKSFRKK